MFTFSDSKRNLMLLVDANGIIVEGPPEPAKDVRGQRLSDILPEEAAGTVYEAFARATADGSTQVVDLLIDMLTVRARIVPLSGGSIIVSVERADCHTLNEQRLEALARLNEMTNATLQEITEFTLEEAVRLTRSRIGYLSFASEDENSLSMHSWSKQSMAECSVTDKPRNYLVSDTGLWGEAVRQRRAVITNDYDAADVLKKGYPEGHVPIRRHMNAPIFDGDRIVIIAGVGNKEEPYDETDVLQLTLLMQGMWRIIQRRRWEQKLRQNEEDLRMAKDAAESSNKAKTQFLANMSHEMRTPLAGMLGMVELTLDLELGDEQRFLLETARKSGDSLLRLISDLLDISRIEAGKMTFERRTFALRECISSAVDTVAFHCNVKGLDVTWNIYPTVPEHLVGDEGRLRQVLVNLLGNAVKFTEKGEVSLAVQMGRESDEGGREVVLFAIRDTGIGIPEEKMEQIFAKFTQVDASTSRKYGGSGLGLALSRDLVAHMGGKLWAESRLGQGSTFYFTYVNENPDDQDGSHIQNPLDPSSFTR